jgi:dihydroorotase
LTEDDANFKMAPPLGNREDRAELRRAVKDGVLMFATDHAPHSAVKKAGGFLAAANGIIGLETAIPITYGVMVEEEGMSPDAWARAWHDMPLSIISESVLAKVGDVLGRTVVEVGEERAVDVSSFASLSRNCPYDGMKWRCWPCS